VTVIHDQEAPRFYGTQMLISHSQNPAILFLSELVNNPDHTYESYSSYVHFNIIPYLRAGMSKVHFSGGLSTKIM